MNEPTLPTWPTTETFVSFPVLTQSPWPLQMRARLDSVCLWPCGSGIECFELVSSTYVGASVRAPPRLASSVRISVY